MNRKRKLDYQSKSVAVHALDTRRAELQGILHELVGVNDNAVAVELNTRGVPALGGGKWQALQIKRLRKSLALEGEYDGVARLYNEVAYDLRCHLERTDMLISRDKLIEYVASTASVFHKWGNMICGGASTEPDVTALRDDTDAEMCRKYLRLAHQLDTALCHCRLISDTFERMLPVIADGPILREVPLPVSCLGKNGGLKSYATMLLEEGQRKIVPLVERRLGLKSAGVVKSFDNIEASPEAPPAA
jgi:hypothetical protein